MFKNIAMKLRKNIATSEEGFIFNPATGDSFSTNPIGTDIFTLLKDEIAFPLIIKTICSKYEVNEIQFEKDLDDFISQLKDYNVLDL
jgi:hypothetical protein